MQKIIFTICLLCFVINNHICGQQISKRNDFVLSPTDYTSFHLSLSGSNHLFLARMEPLVIREGIDEFKLTIGVRNTNVEFLEINRPSFMLYQGNEVEKILLYDDGSHGDETVGDQIFTLNELSFSPSVSSKPVNKYLIRFIDITFNFLDGTQETLNEDLALTMHCIDPSFVSIPQITYESDNIKSTEYVVNIAMNLEGDFPEHYVNTSEVSKIYYDNFSDDRDFLIFVHPYNTAGGPAANAGRVRNYISGIGQSIYDYSANYGSEGHLQGRINVYFGNAFPGTLSHEMLHMWAVFLNESLDLGYSHWGVIERDFSGFGVGAYNGVFNSIEYDSDNTYKCYYDYLPRLYNDLELYLMGLISISDVQSPIRTLVNPEFQNYVHEGLTSYALYLAEGIREVRTEEIVNIEGPREPSYIESQKSFTSSMIVIYDRLLSNLELSFYDYLAREYEKSSSQLPNHVTFEEATSGLASLDLHLSQPISNIENRESLPKNFNISQNYPNPFNPTTNINIKVPSKSNVSGIVFNINGEKIEEIINNILEPGQYTIEWNASNYASGVYLLVFKYKRIKKIIKLLYMK